MLIGFVFNVLLYGIMIAQIYLYYVTYKKYTATLLLLSSILTLLKRQNLDESLCCCTLSR
jgi:hypothetical protein